MRVKTTLNLDGDVVRQIRVRAARLGKRDTEVYEEALRRGLSAIDGLRALAQTSEDDEMIEILDKAVHEVRAKPQPPKPASAQTTRRRR